MILGIDASNIGYGGGTLHLIEILKNVNITEYKINKVIIWGDHNLDSLPNFDWLIKIKPKLLLNGNFLTKSLWKLFVAHKDIFGKCDILFAPGGTFYSKKIPYISMSQNMLAFEKEEAKRYGYSAMYLRFRILNYLQSKSFRNAKGVIFISNYAKKYITQKIETKNSELIPHGISKSFFNKPQIQIAITKFNDQNPFKILYVSAIRPYKHQIPLINAVNLLRKKYPIKLVLIGQEEDPTEVKKMYKTLNQIENYQEFIDFKGPISHQETIEFYKSSNLFAMSSTCENMPNILIEAMAAGLPIASSNYGPMPEFLKDGGEYYDPLDENTIINTIEKLILDPQLRYNNALKAYDYTMQFSWEKCANQTFKYITDLNSK